MSPPLSSPPLPKTTPSLPPTSSFLTLSIPSPYILLVTLNRAKQLNCINTAGHAELHAVWTWMDEEPMVRVGILTGAGDRAFCAGQDLKEWAVSAQQQQQQQQQQSSGTSSLVPSSGFGGLSNRRGKKPIIAAVNGIAYGGGCEMVANADIVFASPSARFALPEVKRGVVAIAGALPRLSRVIGRMRAMEMSLTGRDVSAHEAKEWGLCNGVAEKDGSGEGVLGGVVEMAIKCAVTIAANSPDSVRVSREGVQLDWEIASVEEASEKLTQGLWQGLQSGENIREGLKAFGEKRAPRWVDSKL